MTYTDALNKKIGDTLHLKQKDRLLLITGIRHLPNVNSVFFACSDQKIYHHKDVD